VCEKENVTLAIQNLSLYVQVIKIIRIIFYDLRYVMGNNDLKPTENQ
jgi:hypothetical protein